MKCKNCHKDMTTTTAPRFAGVLPLLVLAAGGVGAAFLGQSMPASWYAGAGVGVVAAVLGFVLARALRSSTACESCGGHEALDEVSALQLEARERKSTEDRLRDELRKAIEKDTRSVLEREVEERLRTELRPKLRHELVPELEIELRRTIEPGIRNETERTLRAKLADELRGDLEKKLTSEIEERLRPQVEHALRPELEKKLRAEIEAKLRKEAEQKPRTPLEAKVSRTEVAKPAAAPLSTAERKIPTTTPVAGQARPAPKPSTAPAKPPVSSQAPLGKRPSTPEPVPARPAAAATAPAQPAVRPANQPPAPVAAQGAPAGLRAAGRTDLPDTHQKAVRKARVMASDVLLYDREEVENAVRTADPFIALEKIWQEAVRTYNESVAADVREGTDYLREAFEDMFNRVKAQLKAR